jgi:hypothetical protein
MEDLMIHYLAGLLMALTLSCGKETNKVTQDAPPSFPPPARPIPPPVDNNPDFVAFDNLESNILLDLNTIPNQDKTSTRYMILCDKFNEKTGNIGVYAGAVNKAVNHLSWERDITNAIAADPNSCIFRINLDDYDLTSQDWRLVESQDPFKLESFTTRGLLIKQLVQTARPWMHAHNFINVAHNDLTYYKLLDIPGTVAQFQDLFGVNNQADFDTFDNDLFLVGFFGSPISLQKNRLLQRNDGDDGPVWSTFDTLVDGAVDATKNLFENPFPLAARSRRVFVADGSEYIATLPNGLHAYALFDAADQIITEAPLNLVIDINAGTLDPTIRNSLSCMKCHNGGTIQADDQIRSHVSGNSSFDAIDSQLADAYFRSPGANAAIFRQDQARYKASMEQLGINTSDDDPVNLLTNTFRSEWTVQQTASFYFLTQEEFIRCLEGSAQAKEQIGQLLNGATVSLDQVIATNPILVRDCNLFQDGING